MAGLAARSCTGAALTRSPAELEPALLSHFTYCSLHIPLLAVVMLHGSVVVVLLLLLVLTRMPPRVGRWGVSAPLSSRQATARLVAIGRSRQGFSTLAQIKLHNDWLCPCGAPRRWVREGACCQVRWFKTA